VASAECLFVKQVDLYFTRQSCDTCGAVAAFRHARPLQPGKAEAELLTRTCIALTIQLGAGFITK